MTFTYVLDDANHVVAEGESFSSVSVQCSRLDDELSSSPILIKIDVEGFETEVIKGGSRTFSSADLKAIIIELNGSGTRYGYSEKDIHEYLVSKGFSPYWYDPFKRELQALSTWWGRFNTIYIRDQAFVSARVKSAAKVVVNGRAI